jgi:hypothetical protein
MEKIIRWNIELDDKEIQINYLPHWAREHICKLVLEGYSKGALILDETEYTNSRRQ